MQDEFGDCSVHLFMSESSAAVYRLVAGVLCAFLRHVILSVITSSLTLVKLTLDQSI